MADYKSFDDVLGELNVSEGELNRLVSEGALRAYKDEGNVKFRAEDVQAMKAGSMGSAPAMSPTEAGRELEVSDETDETLLDLDEVSEDIDFEDTGETSVPTIDLGADVGGTDALTDELSFDDDALDLDGGEETLVADDGLTIDDDDLGLETEPLAGLDDADATIVADDEISLEDDEFSLEGDDIALDGGGGFGAPGFVGAPMAAPQIQIQERMKYVEIASSEKMWTTIVSIVLFIVLVIGFATVISSNFEGDPAGMAKMGFGAVAGDRSSNQYTKDIKFEDIAKPESLAVSAGADAKGVIHVGDSLYRNKDGAVIKPDTK